MTNVNFSRKGAGRGLHTCRHTPSHPTVKQQALFCLDLSTQSHVSGYLSRVLESASNLWHLNCRFINANGAVDAVVVFVLFDLLHPSVF